MPDITIRHTAPVWEETLVTLEVTQEQHDRLVGEDTDYELADELLNAAIMTDAATIQVTGGIDSMDADWEIKGA
jgi:hypothetical protein